MARKINFEMRPRDAALTIADSNVAAMDVCSTLLKKAGEIDPDALFGGRMYLEELDVCNIYGERVNTLFTDVCSGDIGKMIAVLRAHQFSSLAGVTTEALNRAIDNRGAGIDVDAVVAAVQARLPRFNPAAAAA